MIQQPRVIVDTSTLIGAILRPNSVPRQAFLLAVDAYQLCLSTATLQELHAVLHRSKFDRYAPPQVRFEFLDLVVQRSFLWSVDLLSEEVANGACRDANDDKFLALALSSQAAALVSSDADLLVLNPWHGIPILTPAEFLHNGESD